MKQRLKHIIALLLMVLVLFTGCGGLGRATWRESTNNDAGIR